MQYTYGYVLGLNTGSYYEICTLLNPIILHYFTVWLALSRSYAYRDVWLKYNRLGIGVDQISLF